MTSYRARLRIILLTTVFFAVTVYPVEAVAVEPTLVDLWCGGDDVLTLRLRDALEGAFESSPDFRLSSGKEAEKLVVTIPTHVGWKQLGRRTRVLYTIDFSSVDNQKLGTSTGSCWDDAFAKCAARIVKDAKIAARKIRPN
jgi:hypothetical protein